MEEESVMMEILKQYQKKYSIVSEIYRLTEEIGELLSKDDRVSSQLVLEMRQDEMNEADRCGESIGILEDAMEQGDRQHLRLLLDGEEGAKLAETWQEKKIVEIQNNIMQTLQRTVEIDKRISLRIAGKDSFYR